MSGCFAATASAFATGSGRNTTGSEASFRFPQGIASADPQADAILLWTRIVPHSASAAVISDGSQGPVPLRLEVARDPVFKELVLEMEAVADAASDFTVRCFIDGLEPDHHYNYRFIAPDGSMSVVGRTRTSPAPDAMQPLNIAVFSCQHYNDGFFGAYRRLLIDNAAASPEHKIDLIAHVGDFIYEYLDPLMPGPDGQRLELRDRAGNRRGVRPLASGAAPEKRRAVTLEDYRHLYRTYIADPDLMAARARFPFVHIWDDHEIVNDYWQSYTKAGPMQRRKVDANQAWFEYIPAILSRAGEGPAGSNPAHDFARAEVENQPPGPLDDHYLSREPHNLAAIGVMGIHRNVRWGRLVDLFALDGRSYRGERGVDITLLKGSLASYPLSPVSPQLVETLNAGRTADGGQPPATVGPPGETIANPRRNAPVGSLLGADQKAWLKNSLAQSTAVWKLILNDVPFMRFGFDISFRPGGPTNGLLWTDSWDGYPLERRELMGFIRQAQISNVISLTGDRHAHFAGLVDDDFDSDNPMPVLAEFVCASVSAIDRATAHGRVLGHEPDIKQLFAFDGRPFGYASAFVPSLNAWLLFGADAARTLSMTGNVHAAQAQANPAINPHLRYADTDAYGYLVARVREMDTEVEFVTIPPPQVDYGGDDPPVVRRVRYTLARWKPGDAPRLSSPEVEGPPPVLGIKQA